MIRAYAVKEYQIEGPAWLDSERYEITATVPSGTTRDQFLAMIRTFLKERFALRLHHSTKDLPALALLVTKKGPKMKESSVPEPSEITPPTSAPNLSTVSRRPQSKIEIDKDGFPVIPSDKPTSEMLILNGRVTVHAKRITMKEFAEMLGGQSAMPVFDATGLNGKYDFSASWLLNSATPSTDLSGSGDASVFDALGRLGLELKQNKHPTDILVIDNVQKIPTAN